MIGLLGLLPHYLRNKPGWKKKQTMPPAAIVNVQKHGVANLPTKTQTDSNQKGSIMIGETTKGKTTNEIGSSNPSSKNKAQSKNENQDTNHSESAKSQGTKNKDQL